MKTYLILSVCLVFAAWGCENYIEFETGGGKCKETVSYTDSLIVTPDNFDTWAHTDELIDFQEVNLALNAEDFCPKGSMQASCFIEIGPIDRDVWLSAEIFCGDDTLFIPLEWRQNGPNDYYWGSVDDIFEVEEEEDTFSARILFNFFSKPDEFINYSNLIKEGLIKAGMTVTYQKRLTPRLTP